MIKMGVIRNSHSGTESIDVVQQMREFKITGILNSGNNSEEGKNEIDKLLGLSDALCVDQLEEPFVDNLKLFLRSSSHVFLKNPFVCGPSGIRQLISFQQEAGCVIQIFNSCLFHSEVLRIKNKLDSPMLIDIEINREDNEELEMELLNMLLFLLGIEQTGFRKIEVFGLRGDAQSLVNLHIQFVSGSLAQLKIFTNKKIKKNCSLKIHQKETAPFNLDLASSNEKQKTERNALKNFAKGIKQQDAVILSLNELSQALTALQEIKEKLKYPNISL